MVNIDGVGHVNPTLPVVADLVRSGVEVTYFAPAAFEQSVTAVGGHFVPVPSVASVAQHPDGMRAELVWSAAATAPLLVSAFARLRPQVVVHDSLALNGFLAARSLGLPTVSTTTTFVFAPAASSVRMPVPTGLPVLGGGDGSSALTRARAALQPVADRLGVGDLASADPLALPGDDTIVFTCRSLQPSGHALGAHYHFVGPATSGRLEDDDLPWDRLGDPLVYVSFGTMFRPPTALLGAVLDGVSPLARSVLVSTGPHVTGDDLGRWPQNVTLCRSVPQLTVLSRAAAMVTHGGMNSAHEALQAGVPLLVVPLGADQPLVAGRLADTGVGLVLPTTAGPREVAEAMHELLGDPVYRHRAEAVGRELRSGGGASAAAAVIRARTGTAWRGSPSGDRAGAAVRVRR